MTDEPTPDTTTDKPAQPSDATSVERNKAVSRRWIEVFNDRDDAAGADVRAQDYVANAPVSLEPTPLDSEAWTRFLSGFVEAFPDLQLRVEDAVGEGDLVAQRIHFEGTHTGESSKGFRLPTGRSRFPASSSTGSSTAELRSTGSRWTPSRFFSSWVW
ncbi:MAG TPA: ester cyclase [Thermoleophilaceae bacterium]